jgi:hypothetical protein
MKELKSKGAYVILGVLIAFFSMFLIGWSPGEIPEREGIPERPTPIIIPPPTTSGGFTVCCNSVGDVVYVTNLRDVFKSTDYGETWEKITPRTVVIFEEDQNQE